MRTWEGKAGMVDEGVGVQVKLCDPLTTRAIAIAKRFCSGLPYKQAL